MKHEMIPAKNPNVAIDRNDPENAKTAIKLEWPETFSTRAKMVIKYFEGTMFLFLYNDHMHDRQMFRPYFFFIGFSDNTLPRPFSIAQNCNMKRAILSMWKREKK